MATAEEDALLKRQLYSLIVSQLRDDNYPQVATSLANATRTLLHPEITPNKLMELVRKGLAMEREEGPRGGTSTGGVDWSMTVNGAPNSIYSPLPAPNITPLDFSSVQGTKGPSRKFPHHDASTVSEHKNVCRCARFSPDGRLVATGSADTSIKILEVEKLKIVVDAGPSAPETAAQLRPVLRTFYDHLQPINDVDFHPHAPLLISGAKDRTIKFFDFSKPTARRAFRILQDTHNVRSVAFHPCGDFVLAGTDHPLAHLYDINTFHCFLSANLHESHVGGAINQVRYSSNGSLYVTCSKDGGVRLWDGQNARCVRAITTAHAGTEATSAVFSRDQRYVLSCGRDSTVRLWDVGSGRQVMAYVGAEHTRVRCQAPLSHDEAFVLCLDQGTNEVVVWDTRTGELVNRFATGHNGAPRWVEFSPLESAFVTCGVDRSIRFWKA